MKFAILFVSSICLSILSFSVSTQSNEEYYTSALKEFEAKNYEKSLEIIRALHEKGSVLMNLIILQVIVISL